MFHGISTFIIYSLCAVSTSAAAFPHANVLEDAPPGIRYKVPNGVGHHSSAKYFRPEARIQIIRGLTRTKTNSRSAAAVLGAHQREVGGYGYENISATNAYGVQYGVQVSWDGTPMFVVLDTGSADTWAVAQNFSCVDSAGGLQTQADCAFGPLYPTIFHGGLVTPAQHMYVQYADDEIVTGPMGYSDITVGNITVKNQQTCLASKAYWFGNNATSGLLGLAFPALTNSYTGTADTHDPISQVQYSPFFTSMINQGKVAPLFSIFIDRNASTGMIAFGGVPSVPGVDSSQMATLDMIITDLVDRPVTAYQYSFYTIIPDGWQFGQTTNTNKYPFVVDSGTTLCYLPPDLAKAISQAFSPAAVYLAEWGAYFTECDAMPPLIAVILDGIKFFLRGIDLIFKDTFDPATGLCMTGIANGGTGPYILGDVFMQNAVVVFDVGEAKMRFMPKNFGSE